MRKTLLLLLFMGFFTMLLAQERAFLPKEFARIAVKATYERPADKIIDNLQPENMDSWKGTAAITETQIGNTVYDLQSNKLLGNRVCRFDDGTIGAVWTMGLSATSFPDRGTGYNYFDGTSWGAMPAGRIESLKTGWPSIAPLGENGEIIVSHDFTNFLLYFLTRENKGTGVWTETAFTYSSGPPRLAWPRLMTGGEDKLTVHMLANSYEAYQGMTTGTVYSRSIDGGLTWDIENILIDGMGPDNYLEIAADEYIWAEPRNGKIAFLCASAWHDMFMMKSDDNGDSWDKTVIWEHPYPFFDWNVTITDTFFCVDNSAGITLDYDGKAHVVFGINRVLHDAVGTSYFLFPYVDGIGYWNEDMETFSNDLSALSPPYLGYPNSELVEDYNYIGWMQDVNGDGQIDLNTDILYYRELGPSTMPTIHADENGFMAVIFASTTETYEVDVYNYKHLWARPFAGNEWHDFTDLTKDIVHIFDECIYPQLAQSSDNKLYYMYNADVTPGVALDDAHGYQDNRQVFAMVDKSDLYPAIGYEELSSGNSNFSVSQNIPNPINGNTTISIETRKPLKLGFTLQNAMGQEVYRLDLGRVDGRSTIILDTSLYPGGLYFYTVTSGNEKITKKMIIN